MKSVLRNIALSLAATLGATGAMHAATSQPPAVVRAGTIVLTFDARFIQALKDQGITTTYIDNERSSKTSPEFQIEGGLVNRDTGSSEIQSMGGVTFKSATTTVSLQRLALESNETNAAHLTALVIVNGESKGRHAVFTVTSGPSFTFPIKLGHVSSGDINFKVNPAFASEISSYFQVSPDTYKGMVGEFELNLQLVPQDQEENTDKDRDGHDRD